MHHLSEKDTETKAGDAGYQARLSSLLISKTPMQTRYDLEILHPGHFTNTWKKEHAHEKSRPWLSIASYYAFWIAWGALTREVGCWLDIKEVGHCFLPILSITVGEQELGILLLFPQSDLTSLKYLNYKDNFTYMFILFCFVSDSDQFSKHFLIDWKVNGISDEFGTKCRQSLKVVLFCL